MDYLINLSFKSSLILLSSGLIILGLKNASASLRHWLLSLTMIILFALPAFVKLAPFFKIETNLLLERRELPSEKAINQPPLIEKSKLESPLKDQTNEGRFLEENLLLDSELAAEKSKLKINNKIEKIEFSTAILWIWLLGAAFFLIKFLIGLYKIYSLTKKSNHFVLTPKLKDWQLDFYSKNIQYFISAEIASPMTWGIMRSKILLPKIAENWTNQELKTVLLHELIHVKRRDYWLHLIGLLALCLYWYNPLMWWIQKRQLLEREKACDEAVLSVGITGYNYAQQLINIAKKLSDRSPNILVMTDNSLPMARTSQIKERVLAILKFDPSQFRFSNKMKWNWGVFYTAFMSLLTMTSLVATQLNVPFYPIEKLETLSSFVQIADNQENIEIKSILYKKEHSEEAEEKTTIIDTIEQIISLDANKPLSIKKETPILLKTNDSERKIANLPLSPIVEIEKKGLYGQWKEGNSEFKVWTYGGVNTLKNLPYIEVREEGAMVVIEEKRKTLLKEQKFQLIITKAPYDGLLVRRYEAGEPVDWYGGYWKGTPLFLWSVDDEWKLDGNGRDEWIAANLRSIAYFLELSSYEDKFIPVSEKNTAWWQKIQRLQKVKRLRFHPDNLSMEEMNDLGWFDALKKKAKNTIISAQQFDKAIKLRKEGGYYKTWKEGRSQFSIWTYGNYKVNKEAPFIEVNQPDDMIILQEVRNALLGGGAKRYMLTITKAPFDGHWVYNFLDTEPSTYSSGHQKGHPLYIWSVNGAYDYDERTKKKWMNRNLEKIADLLNNEHYFSNADWVGKDDKLWQSMFKVEKHIKKQHFLSAKEWNNQKETMEKIPSFNPLKLNQIPFQKIQKETFSGQSKTYGRTENTIVKTGCNGCKLKWLKFATLMETSETPSLIQDINFHLAKNDFDVLDFQLYLFKVEKGKIKHALTQKPIPIRLEKGAINWVKKDLSDYNIITQGTIYAVLEAKHFEGKKKSLFLSFGEGREEYMPLSRQLEVQKDDFWEQAYAVYFTVR